MNETERRILETTTQQNDEFSQMLINRDEFIRSKGLWEEYLEWIKTHPPEFAAKYVERDRDR